MGYEVKESKATFASPLRISKRTLWLFMSFQFIENQLKNKISPHSNQQRLASLIDDIKMSCERWTEIYSDLPYLAGSQKSVLMIN